MGTPKANGHPQASKDLLHLERCDPSSPLGAKLSSICETKRGSYSTPGTTYVTDRATQPPTESSVLSRVKAFLPILDEANRKLTSSIQEKGAEEFDIEVLNGGERESYVEMDLALGVADLHTPEAVAAAERAVSGQVLDVSPSTDTDDTDTEDESNGSTTGEDDDCCNKGQDRKTNHRKDFTAMRSKRAKIEQL